MGYVSALADHYGNPDLLKKIILLHDHKGDLTVEWNKPPKDGEKDIFAKAWVSMNELAENISHKIVILKRCTDCDFSPSETEYTVIPVCPHCDYS